MKRPRTTIPGTVGSQIGVAILCASIFVMAPILANGDQPITPAPSPAGEQTEQLDGFWPTPRMIDNIVKRWAAEAANVYQLDPQQATEVESRLRDRWTGFLAKNRRDLQPLLNEYVEARLSVEPPDSDTVADWAARAMPVYQRLRANIEAGESEVRTMLNADQRTTFDKRHTQRWAGLHLLESSLKRWSVGNFKRSEWWDPPPGWRDNKAGDDGAAATEQAVRPMPSAAPIGPDDPDRVTAELGKWEQYVAEYCDRHQFDVSQRNAAQSMLREIIERATNHVEVRRDRIEALEAMISDPTTTDKEKVDRELEALYGPLDRMFEELTSRLSKLPTTSQFRHAELQKTPPTQSPAQRQEQPAEPE